jgi:dipeptidyl-peptidase-4
MPFIRRATLIALSLCVALPALGQQRSLSVDLIYHPDRRVDFGGAPATDMTWLDASNYVVASRARQPVEWLKVNAVTGQSTRLYDPSALEKALAAVQGLDKEDVAGIVRSGGLALNSEATAGLLAAGDDLFVFEFASGRLDRLTTKSGAEEEATFSPDGRSVAFVRGNNLHVVGVRDRKEKQLTKDGGPQILNGKLDWLYQEEIYGRGRFRSYWWSPDSSKLAFLRLDETLVPEYTVADEIPYRPRLEVTDYPKAGDPNPLVALGVAGIGGGIEWIELDKYKSSEFLIVDVDWTTDSKHVVHQVQNREQTWLDLNLSDSSSGKTRTLFRETTKAWVDPYGSAQWLKDGSFLWLSARNGFKHVYHYGGDGVLKRQVTTGPWEVRALYGVDQASGLVYFTSPERSSTDVDIYRVALDGSRKTRLSQTAGTHRAIFNPTFSHYVGVWNDVTTPNQVRLHTADGGVVRIIDANPVPALAEFKLSKPEFVKVKARDGYMMDAMLVKPPDFDPSRRYPVYQFTYAGPTAAEARNTWRGAQAMFHQLLAQNGVVVWVHDNRSASGPAEAQWPVHGRLGELELQDLEDGIAWLKQQPFIDASRIVLSGWSYGGFMAAYALTHSKSWAGGIVGAPVTDWRDYDTVYTERLMKLPKENEDGYRRTAPRWAAASLSGKMLLIHGTMDDNVHMQNSVQFAYELQRAGKPFESMIYPRQRHGFTDARLNAHLRQLMFDFTMRTVK